MASLTLYVIEETYLNHDVTWYSCVHNIADSKSTQNRKNLHLLGITTMTDGFEEQVPFVKNFSGNSFDFPSLICLLMLAALLWLILFLPFLLLLLLLEQ